MHNSWQRGGGPYKGIPGKEPTPRNCPLFKVCCHVTAARRWIFLHCVTCVLCLVYIQPDWWHPQVQCLKDAVSWALGKLQWCGARIFFVTPGYLFFTLRLWVYDHPHDNEGVTMLTLISQVALNQTRSLQARWQFSTSSTRSGAVLI